MHRELLFSAMVLVATLSLAGCGGGGGGNPTSQVTSLDTFALDKAYKDLLATGWSINYAITGSCTGTAVRNEPAPAGASFANRSAFSVTSTITINTTNCAAMTVTTTAVRYNDTNLNPLGYVNPGLEYAEYTPSPITIPITVKVGDTATLGTAVIYTDSSKTTAKGASQLSVVIEPDSATSAIVDLIDKRYDLSAQLLSTTQDRYRIDSTGKLTPLTLDVQYSGSSGTDHLLFTPP